MPHSKSERAIAPITNMADSDPAPAQNSTGQSFVVDITRPAEQGFDSYPTENAGGGEGNDQDPAGTEAAPKKKKKKKSKGKKKAVSSDQPVKYSRSLANRLSPFRLNRLVLKVCLIHSRHIRLVLTGASENYADAPMTPAEHEEETKDLYHPSVPDRIPS